MTAAKNAIVSGSRTTKYVQTGRGRKNGMIIPEYQKQEPEKLYSVANAEKEEKKSVSYRFGDDERELTAGEKEMYKLAGELAKKIDNAGMVAAIAEFSKMTYKEFKRAFKMPEWVRPEEYYFFSKSFYEAYCFGYEEGEKKKEHQAAEKQKK